MFVKIEPLKNFITRCGHFYNAFISENICVNSGFNCKHPDQKEVCEGIGCCYSWSCPIGIEPHESYFKDPDINIDGHTHIKGAFIIPVVEDEFPF